jgi:hypothetical protein
MKILVGVVVCAGVLYVADSYFSHGLYFRAFSQMISRLFNLG